jgi:hypothetical protein
MVMDLNILCTYVVILYEYKREMTALFLVKPVFKIYA